MTALQQHDSLGPHPALNWPIEVTEFAYIGDAVAAELNQLDLFDSPLSESHYGSYVWTVGSDEAPPLELCGTSTPGEVHFAEPFESFIWELYRDAGFYEDPRNANEGLPPSEQVVYYPPVPRPCVGDPRMDPTVLEEGCMLPWLSPATFFGVEEYEEFHTVEGEL
jgi:hypothetical protein